jgi:hypothetical protein
MTLDVSRLASRRRGEAINGYFLRRARCVRHCIPVAARKFSRISLKNMPIDNASQFFGVREPIPSQVPSEINEGGRKNRFNLKNRSR